MNKINVLGLNKAIRENDAKITISKQDDMFMLTIDIEGDTIEFAVNNLNQLITMASNRLLNQEIKNTKTNEYSQEDSATEQLLSRGHHVTFNKRICEYDYVRTEYIVMQVYDKNNRPMYEYSTFLKSGISNLLMILDDWARIIVESKVTNL